jgi:type I restriction enzyme S subunit
MSIATLQIEKKKTLVPQLRFQEYDDKWTKIKNTIQIIAGNAYSLNDYQDEGIILIQGLNIAPGKLDTSTINYISETHKAKHIVLSEGDILLGLNRPVTNGELKVCRYSLKTRGYLYQRAGKLQFNKDQIYSDFLYQYLRSANFLKEITNELVGSDQPYIRSNLFQVVKLNFPTLPEQQKIASFLSAVDEKIQQLSRKKELLEQYKKGVIQILFSGKLRFKDENGKDYTGWEEKNLGDIAKRNANKNKDNQVNFVLTNSATQGIVSQADYFDREIANQNNLEGYYIVEVDDFVYNPRISVHAPVGPIKRNKLTQGVMSPLYSVFRFKEGNLQFFEYFFETIRWHEYLESVSNKGARHDRMNITNSDFFKMPISFPCIEEQQKITHFLSSIDSKIKSTNQQLAQTQSFKKGLLQQMFV